MNIIELLQDAKRGNEKACNEIIKHYEKYIFYNMHKYSINDKNECLEDVKQRIRRAIFLFKIKLG